MDRIGRGRKTSGDFEADPGFGYRGFSISRGCLALIGGVYARYQVLLCFEEVEAEEREVMKENREGRRGKKNCDGSIQFVRLMPLLIGNLLFGPEFLQFRDERDSPTVVDGENPSQCMPISKKAREDLLGGGELVDVTEQLVVVRLSCLRIHRDGLMDGAGQLFRVPRVRDNPVRHLKSDQVIGDIPIEELY